MCAFVSTRRKKMGAGGESSSSSSGNQNGCSNDVTNVILNVYDLTPINNYSYCLGFGIFHSGIEVHGKEYGFGAHDFPISGVFEVEPKSCHGFIYRCSIALGCIHMPFSEFRTLIESVASEYHGDTYHLISKNCNHFTDDIVHRLTGKHIPGWVNRLARIGYLCSCLLPESLQVTTVKRLPEYHEIEEGIETVSIARARDSTEIDDTDTEKQLLSPKEGPSDISFIKEARTCDRKEA
ncbi:DeSI-like protein [Hibiscus syriacus]|uniref:DeSI-like protein n=1 Tax=Hibiscus syriacus TaxID=106335 RepID=A0A6A2XK04_HIBSY|nr:deSI-like protein At4g17486 [Hibiscus syriacus]KAE8675892.1 DeSI-like protein [Hibiscus syriacus]